MAKSICETEYITCFYTANQLVWITKILKKFKFIYKSILYTDLQSIIFIIKNYRINIRIKYITVYYHYTREYYTKNSFTVVHVPFINNLADIYIKIFFLPLFRIFIKGIMDTGG